MPDMITPELLELLACPACAERPSLRPAADGGRSLECTQCGRCYPVEDGIPVLLLDAVVPAVPPVDAVSGRQSS